MIKLKYGLTGEMIVSTITIVNKIAHVIDSNGDKHRIAVKDIKSMEVEDEFRINV